MKNQKKYHSPSSGMSNILNPTPNPHHTNLRFLNYATYSSTSSTPSLFVTAAHGNQTNNTLLPPVCLLPPDEIALTKMIIIVVCFLSLFIGLSGNLVIVIVRIFKQVQRRNTTAYTFLIGQLAIADFVFAFTICFDINSYLNNDLWTLSVSSCRFIKLIQSASLTTTVGFLTIMAYERYCGISRPLKHHWSIRRTTIITLVLWAYVVLTFVPMVTALDIDECGYCAEFKHPSEAFRKGYTMFLFSTNYVAPLISIIVFHTLIVYRMKKHLKAMQSQRHRSTASPSANKRHSTKFDSTLKNRKASTMSTMSIADDSVCGRHGDSNCWVVLYHLLCEKLENKNNNNNEIRTDSENNSNNGTPKFASQSTRHRSNVFKRLVTRSKTNEDKKLVKMLVAVTMSFALMTLPTQIYYIWYDFRVEQERLSDEVLKVVEVFSSLVYLHCCMNCVIYSAMDKKFRADVGKTFRFIFNCQQKKTPTSRNTFQRVTMVSRLSRLSRHSLSTTATTTTSISMSKRSDDVFLKKKKKQLSVIEDENSVLKNTMTVVDDNKNEVFLYEKETVIM